MKKIHEQRSRASTGSTGFTRLQSGDSKSQTKLHCFTQWALGHRYHDLVACGNMARGKARVSKLSTQWHAPFRPDPPCPTVMPTPSAVWPMYIATCSPGAASPGEHTTQQHTCQCHWNVALEHYDRSEKCCLSKKASVTTNVKGTYTKP